MRAPIWAAGAIAALLAVPPIVASPPKPAPRVASFADHQAQCVGKEGWSDPAPPIRIFGNVYDVGTCNIVVLLIAGDRGAVVIDGATAEAVPSIVANIERLGFRPSDVKLLLSTHEHGDHAGGLRDLRRRTGATMAATPAARAALESGVPARDDPQRTGSVPEFRGVPVDRTVRDGEVVALGSLRLTAHATPGHAPGSTSWSWRSCANGICHRIVYADSVSAISSEGYRFARHPAYVAAFRASLARIAALPCDLIVTPHPAASSLYERLAGSMPLSSASACAAYADSGRTKLDQRLAAETRPGASGQD
ncbi:subclass B3 metallo-beta-lactamase [Sphingomonas sp.]|uniref:subclass B3 metallo-beta-lactamase n=1 Tax=Sphingomonas sp. TaxID=28214 RepID=UPI003B0019B1